MEQIKQVVVDGQNLAFRSAFIFKDQPFGMEYGFLRSLIALAKRYNTSNIRVTWDSYCVWRRELYPTYKESKTKFTLKGARLDILNRLAAFKMALSYVVPQYSCEGSEADDIMAALSRMLAPDHVVIVSTDRDMLQLVTDWVTVHQPKKKGVIKEYTPALVCKEWNIKAPYDLRWVRAYAGDVSDNLPGCGVPKKLLAQCVDGVWIDGASQKQKAINEQQATEDRAQVILTPGWLKRLTSFHDQALINYEIMCLVPPRLGPLIRCDYNPDSERISRYCERAGISALIPSIMNHFYFQRDVYTQVFLENPFLVKQRETQVIPSSP